MKWSLPVILLALSAFWALSIASAALAQSATAPATRGAAPTGLPPGHPDLATLGTSGPMLQANIFVVVSQKTAGGPAIAGDSVTLDLYAPNQGVQHFQAKLDAQGKASFSNLSYRGICQPLLTIKHAGVDYHAVGGTMNSQHPEQTIGTSVFETTPQAPALTSQMRHVIVTRTNGGLRVDETFDINVPGDRTWLGNAQSDGSHVTLDLALSANAADPQLPQDLQAMGIQFVGAHLLDTAPLIPGGLQIQFAYTLPVKDASATLDIAMPIAVGHCMLFVPDDGSTISAPGFESRGVYKMGKGNMRCYFGMALPVGKNIQVGFTHLATPPPPTTQAGADWPLDDQSPSDQPLPDQGANPGSPRWPIIAGGISAVVVICGTFAIFMRPAHRTAKKG